MKHSLVFLFLFPFFANATNYYISNDGNDNRLGNSESQAWQSISKLNNSFSNFRGGDSVFFKRGDVFYGSIIIKASGLPDNPIVLSAYGKGTNPVITGLTKISGWAKIGAAIWTASVNAKTNLNLITINGMPQRIGRYPNANDADGGYLRYEEFEDNNSITDKELRKDIDWTGAEVIIRKNHWTAERCRVTAQTANTIFYKHAVAGINTTDVPKLYNGTKGNGYFFQNDPRTLDELGEWYFDSSNKKLQIYFGKSLPSNFIIKASTIDTLVDIGNKSFINFINLDFEGANKSALYCRDGNDISIQYCNFKNIGAKAIHFWNSANIFIDHVNTSYVLSNAIQVRNSKQDNVTVSNCILKNTGPFIGMGSFFDDRDYKAISVMAHKNVLIENNVIDSVGLTAIQFQGSNVLVKNNFVNNFCYVLDDGAGIYTYTESSREGGLNFINRIITGNIILNGLGALAGSISMPKAEGIYLDGSSMNVIAENNTIAYVSNKALACNNPVHVKFIKNTCFNNGGGWGAARLNTWENIEGLIIRHNIFYPVNDQQQLVNFIHSGLDQPLPVSICEALQSMGSVDSNYYNIVNPAAFNYSYAPKAGKQWIYPSPLSFDNWQAFSGQDFHSKLPSKILSGYQIKNIIGNNLVAGGDFKTNINAVNIFGSNVKSSWAKNEKLVGSGSLKIEVKAAEANRYVMVHGPVGILPAGKKYVLRFKTMGSSECGIVKAYLRKTEKPYTELVAKQTAVFGTSVGNHQFLFELNQQAETSFVIEVEKNAGIFYVDDIELYEVNAQVKSIATQVRFEYNASAVEISIPLSKNYIGVDGLLYSGTLKLAPFSSIILLSRNSWDQ